MKPLRWCVAALVVIAATLIIWFSIGIYIYTSDEEYLVNETAVLFHFPQLCKQLKSGFFLFGPSDHDIQSSCIRNYLDTYPERPVESISPQ